MRYLLGALAGAVPLWGDGSVAQQKPAPAAAKRAPEVEPAPAAAKKAPEVEPAPAAAKKAPEVKPTPAAAKKAPSVVPYTIREPYRLLRERWAWELAGKYAVVDGVFSSEWEARE
jgi:hypothetical protein